MTRSLMRTDIYEVSVYVTLTRNPDLSVFNAETMFMKRTALF